MINPKIKWPRFAVGDTVQVVGVISKRVILDRCVIVSMALCEESVWNGDGNVIADDMPGWGYELSPPPPESRSRFTCERNLRPIPPAGSTDLLDMLYLQAPVTSDEGAR